MTTTAQRPNILILMPDQLRADALSCARHPVFRTPHIDRLAREGVHFTHAYATSPLCMPARASVLSGVYPHNHQIQENTRTALLPADDETFAHLLQRTGYRTAYVGKTHFYHHEPGVSMFDREDYVRARGFEDVHETTGPNGSRHMDNHVTRYWAEHGLLETFREDYARRAREGGGIAVWPSPLPAEHFLDSYIGARALDWLQAHDGARPFCLWVAFGGPHTPWDAPGHYATMYEPDSLPDPLPVETPQAWVPDHARERMLGGKEYDPRLTPQLSRRLIANYGGKVTLIDEWVGKLLAELDRRGLAENTLVVFWSDHGEMGGDHLRRDKRVFYESSVRVPIILRWPAGFAARPPSDALVDHVDLFTTIVHAAGAPASQRAFGRSLLPIARGEAATVHDAVFSEVRREVMVRTERWKYAVDPQARGYLLHDMQADPHEQRNLIGHPEYVGVERALREQMFDWLVTTQVQR